MLERGGGGGAYRVGSLLEDVLQRGQVAHQFVITRLDGCQGCYQLVSERGFEIAVASVRELILNLLRRLARQQLVDAEQVVDAGAIRVERYPALRVRGGARNLLFNGFGIVQQIDTRVGIRVALAHLLRWIIQRHDTRAHLANLVLRDDEDLLAVVRVEALRQVAREFDVLSLVVAHRDVMGLVQQDVAGHQDGVTQQACGDAIQVLARFRLELRHPVQPAERREALHDPAGFGMFMHM